MDKTKAIIQLLRIPHWTKNLFIFLPLFFGKKFHSLDVLFVSLVVFMAFSLAASAIYCFNDIHDIEKDKLHPDNSNRPLASGRLSIKTAYLVMSICLILAGLILIVFPEPFRLKVALVILLYLVLNFFYTLYLKQITIIDVFIISFGFLLRIIAGGVSSETLLSPWIVLMTFLLTLLLAFAKRRDDLVIKKDKGIDVRTNTKSYNKNFIDVVLSILAAIIFVCYVMYTMSNDVLIQFDNQYTYVTALFVLAGLLRYLQITLVDEKSGSPTKVLIKDRFIQITILLWIISFYFIIYG